MFFTSIVDTFKKYTIEIAHVKRVCINAEMDEFLVLRLVNEQADTAYKLVKDAQSILLEKKKEKLCTQY